MHFKTSSECKIFTKELCVLNNFNICLFMSVTSILMNQVKFCFLNTIIWKLLKEMFEFVNANRNAGPHKSKTVPSFDLSARMNGF